METTMLTLVKMAQCGDFNTRVTNDARLVTVAEMLEAGRIIDERFSVLPEPEHVVLAYRATNMVPKRGEFFSTGDCGCALGVVARFESGSKDCNSASDFWLERMNDEWIKAFSCGFDGEEVSDIRQEDEDLLTVYLQGRACWDAVVAAGLVQMEGALSA